MCAIVFMWLGFFCSLHPSAIRQKLFFRVFSEAPLLIRDRYFYFDHIFFALLTYSSCTPNTISKEAAFSVCGGPNLHIVHARQHTKLLNYQCVAYIELLCSIKVGPFINTIIWIQVYYTEKHRPNWFSNFIVLGFTK